MVLRDVLKRGHRRGNLFNDSCLNVYKGVLESFQCFESGVLKLCLMCVLKNGKDCFASLVK